MIKKILIANRGEIAVRIIRACKELDIKTVSIYSKDDEKSLHVKMADESVCVGCGKSRDTYLNMNNIISAAICFKCDAIHPGYGFLSESYEFAKKVEDNNLIFIGPSWEVISSMGDKIQAINLMRKNGVRIVPGSLKEIKNYEELIEIADQIGYPLLIKASGGGGGRGMRKVYDKSMLKSSFESAKKESIAAFNNDSMYIEKLILNPKHIEVQILSDKYGNCISLGERDCSIQRKNQKMIEESPCISLSESLRKKLSNQAILAAKSCNYVGAGTVEFVMDKDNFYFIEMNTRIQVEHPVTEMATGIDIVKEQIKIASGERLSIKQEDIKFTKHAIECRINAENPLLNFAPQAGNIDFVNFPGGGDVRFDTYIYNGYTVSPYYDSMLGKIIVAADTRKAAIRKLRNAIEELVIDGIYTNSYLQYAILFNDDFVNGNYSTDFIEKNIDDLIKLVNVGE